MCDRNSSKTWRPDEIMLFSFNTHCFKSLYAMFLFRPSIPGVPKHMKCFESLITIDSHVLLYLSIFRYAKLKNVGLLFKFKKRFYLL